jgi:L-lactate dehydrogenase complex protein LldF
MWLLAKWGASGILRYIPLTGAWTKDRDLPAPTGTTFQRQWQNAQRNNSQKVSP